MPHLILEHSNNITDELNYQQILISLHQEIAKFDGFKINNLKSRVIAHESYLVSEGNPNNVFVHISLAILSGRDAELKKLLADKLFEKAKEFFPITLQNSPHSFTLEIRELDKVTYRKVSNL